MVDLKDRLGKLGFLPAAALPTILPKKKERIEDVVNGNRITNNQGDVILIERNYPYGSLYGDSIIQEPDNKNEIFKFTIKDQKVLLSPSLIFVDTETTGLSGGTGTIPFLIGIGYYDQAGFSTKQFLLENPAEEMAQLVEFSRELTKFSTTVTFNGKSFDLPLIRTRFLLNRFTNPLENYSHIDLLHISRKIWKNRLTDRSLQELEARILNYSRSQEDVPGWLIPQIYFDFLKTGDGSQIKNVIYHNQIDVVSMAILYQKIQSMLLSTDNIKDLHPLDVYSIAKMYFQVGELERSLSLFEQCLIRKDISIDVLFDSHMTMAAIHKKADNHEEAVSHWLFCAEKYHFEACIELAKYYEHKVEKINDAITWTVKAAECVEMSPLPRYEKINITNKINKRLIRLKRRNNYVQEKN